MHTLIISCSFAVGAYGHSRPLREPAGAPDSLTAKAPNTRIGTCAGPEVGDARHAKNDVAWKYLWKS